MSDYHTVMNNHSHALPGGLVVTRSGKRLYTHVVVATDESGPFATWHMSHEAASRQAGVLIRRGFAPVNIEEINNGERS